MIPNTIIFENNKATAWYFYNGSSKEILKKRKVTIENILKEFSELKLSGEVVATFFQKKQFQKTHLTCEFLTYQALSTKH